MDECFSWLSEHKHSVVFLGQPAPVQDPDAEEMAKEWSSLCDFATTVKDVWEYFKKVKGLEDFDISSRFEYDPDLFGTLLSKEPDFKLGFGFTAKHAIEIRDSQD